jgi:hypothetical protein
MRDTFPGRGAARSSCGAVRRRSTVLVVKCFIRPSFEAFRACDIVLGRQGRFAPPSAVAFGQP